MTRIKICCIASMEEAALAVRYGASALGLVSAMPSGPGPIDEDLIARIRRTVPPAVATFLLTCQTNGDAIVAQLRRTGCNTIQLCDAVAPGAYATIRRECPAVSIVQVIHVADANAIEEARAAEEHVDGILLDSGRPTAAVKELGGTGRVHDWTISRKLVESVKRPVFLAGGLNPTNVAEAIRQVRPFGVDLCTGVRTNGVLDDIKLRAFVAAVHTA